MQQVIQSLKESSSQLRMVQVRRRLAQLLLSVAHPASDSIMHVNTCQYLATLFLLPLSESFQNACHYAAHIVVALPTSGSTTTAQYSHVRNLSRMLVITLLT